MSRPEDESLKCPECQQLIAEPVKIAGDVGLSEDEIDTMCFQCAVQKIDAQVVAQVDAAGDGHQFYTSGVHDDSSTDPLLKFNSPDGKIALCRLSQLELRQSPSRIYHGLYVRDRRIKFQKKFADYLAEHRALREKEGAVDQEALKSELAQLKKKYQSTVNDPDFSLMKSLDIAIRDDLPWFTDLTRAVSKGDFSRVLSEIQKAQETTYKKAGNKKHIDDFKQQLQVVEQSYEAYLKAASQYFDRQYRALEKSEGGLDIELSVADLDCDQAQKTHKAELEKLYQMHTSPELKKADILHQHFPNHKTLLFFIEDYFIAHPEMSYENNPDLKALLILLRPLCWFQRLCEERRNVVDIQISVSGENPLSSKVFGHRLLNCGNVNAISLLQECGYPLQLFSGKILFLARQFALTVSPENPISALDKVMQQAFQDNRERQSLSPLMVSHVIRYLINKDLFDQLIVFLSELKKPLEPDSELLHFSNALIQTWQLIVLKHIADSIFIERSHCLVNEWAGSNHLEKLSTIIELCREVINRPLNTSGETFVFYVVAKFNPRIALLVKTLMAVDANFFKKSLMEDPKHACAVAYFYMPFDNKKVFIDLLLNPGEGYTPLIFPDSDKHYHDRSFWNVPFQPSEFYIPRRVAHVFLTPSVKYGLPGFNHPFDPKFHVRTDASGMPPVASLSAMSGYNAPGVASSVDLSPVRYSAATHQLPPLSLSDFLSGSAASATSAPYGNGGGFPALASSAPNGNGGGFPALALSAPYGNGGLEFPAPAASAPNGDTTRFGFPYSGTAPGGDFVAAAIAAAAASSVNMGPRGSANYTYWRPSSVSGSRVVINKPVVYRLPDNLDQSLKLPTKHELQIWSKTKEWQIKLYRQVESANKTLRESLSKRDPNFKEELPNYWDNNDLASNYKKDVAHELSRLLEDTERLIRLHNRFYRSKSQSTPVTSAAALFSATSQPRVSLPPAGSALAPLAAPKLPATINAVDLKDKQAQPSEDSSGETGDSVVFLPTTKPISQMPHFQPRSSGLPGVSVNSDKAGTTVPANNPFGDFVAQVKGGAVVASAASSPASPGRGSSVLRRRVARKTIKTTLSLSDTTKPSGKSSPQAPVSARTMIGVLSTSVRAVSKKRENPDDDRGNDEAKKPRMGQGPS